MRGLPWTWPLLVIAAPSLAGGATPQRPPARRPNILFVVADDWSHPHAGAYGDRTVRTPAFDRIAREGALFSHAFTAAPSCTPSRAAILTGQAVHRLAEGGNLHGMLPARFEVYPDLLGKAGYHVGFAGKGWGPGRFEEGGRRRNPAGPRFDDFGGFLAKRSAGQPFCFWFGSANPHRPYESGSGARAGLRARNYRPERWPAGDPELHHSVGPFGDIDDGPSKQLLLSRRSERDVAHFFAAATARRPAEELFDLAKDPAQLVNLAGDAAHAPTLERLRRELSAWQRATGDPRLAEDDDRWDRFPCYGPPAKAEPARSEASAPAPARANILLIVADDLGYTDLGVLGGEIRTPRIDALARSGLLLTSFLVSPACSPTRAMLLAGTDTHPAGLGTMAGEADENQKGRPGYEGYLSERVVSVATLLREAGYHTYMAGKWHLGMEERHGPQLRGFERSFALLPGGASHFSDAAGLVESQPRAPYREDGREVPLPEDFYSTAHYTDKLIEYIRGGLGDGKPFFAYAAYTAPHWPLQVPDAELDRYRGAYDEGYDVLRARRFEGARRLGVVPATAVVPQRTPFARPWDALAPDEKRREARAMELYAAMVENLDHHVGRLLQFLKHAGQWDDTLILFFPDNGAEGNQVGRMQTNASWIPKRFDNRLANLGRVDSYAWLGPAWAQAVTPFRLWKAFPTEGGVRVPAIVRLGARGRRGRLDAVATVKDVAPTLLELAGVRHPAPTFEGRAVAPLEGRSLLPLVTGASATVHGDDFTMGWELFGRRALRRGSLKLVWMFEPYGPARWQLFDVAADPTESNDLSATHPQRLAELLAAWEEYAARNGVVLPSRDMGYGLESPAR